MNWENAAFENLTDMGYRCFSEYWERHCVCQALEKSKWNVTQAAKLIGLKRTTFIEKMRKLSIRIERKEG